LKFEFIHALHDLDRKTKAYFITEIFAHGDLSTKRYASKILETLGTKPYSIKALIHILDSTRHPESQQDRIY
jgi:hypothetical protein